MVTTAPHWAIPILRVLAWGVLVQCSARACSRSPRVSRATCLRPYASAGCFDVGPPPFFAPSPLLPRQRRIAIPAWTTPQECFPARPPSTAPGHRQASTIRASHLHSRQRRISIPAWGNAPGPPSPKHPKGQRPALSQRRSPSGEAPPHVRNRRRRTQYLGQLPSPSTPLRPRLDRLCALCALCGCDHETNYHNSESLFD
jgi:hypothetical protein